MLEWKKKTTRQKYAQDEHYTEFKSAIYVSHSSFTLFSAFLKRFSLGSSMSRRGNAAINYTNTDGYEYKVTLHHIHSSAEDGDDDEDDDDVVVGGTTQEYKHIC